MYFVVIKWYFLHMELDGQEKKNSLILIRTEKLNQNETEQEAEGILNISAMH